MMKEKKLSQMILKLHDRAEAAKYDGDSSPPYQEVEMLNFHDEESVVHTVLEDFYAVGALADELTHGFHMEERGYIGCTGRSISTNPDGKEKKIKSKNQVAGFNNSLDFEKSTLYRKVYADTGKGKARIGGSGDCFRDGISESSEKVGIYEVAFEKKGPKKTKSALQKNL